MTGKVAPRFPALDGLRAVGALAVLLTHVGYQSGDATRGPFAGLLGRMDAGVAVFFVISGFLLARPHVEAHLGGGVAPRLGSYLWHRAIRILPVLWIAVAAAAALVWTAHAAGSDYLRYALLVHIYTDVPLLEGLTQMWSLATEVAFYLALPAIAWLVCRGRADAVWVRRVLACCVLLAFAGAAWMAGSTSLGHPIARLWLPGFLGWFAAGMGLAAWNVARTKGMLRPGGLDVVAQHPGTVWAAAAALFVLVGTPIAGPLDLSDPTPAAAATKNLLYGLLGLLVVLPAVATSETPSAILRHVSGRVGHYLGSISYGVFAYHVLILALVERWLGLDPFAGQFAPRFGITLLGSVFLATASFYGLERPLMRRARRREAVRTFILEGGAPTDDYAPASEPASTGHQRG